MAEPLEPPAPLFASRGGTSIKSFKLEREGMSTSSPPSIGGDSTRRKAFGMSFLSRRAKNQPSPTLDSLAVTEKLLHVHAEVPQSSENLHPALQSRNPSRRGTEPMSLPSSPAATAAAKKQPSSSLFRKLTTKFNRNRSRSSSPPPRENKRRSIAPPPGNNNTTLAARNAALRERGLLPPLPLSVQEAQQDMHIAVVTSPEPGEESGLERRNTAANRVKEEWEAKNRERLTGFRFGGNSPAGSPTQASFPTNGLDPVAEVDTPLPSPGLQDPPFEFGEADELERNSRPRAPPPTLNLGRGHHLSPPLMQAWSDMPPDPWLLPLPPSPGSTTESKFSSLISAFANTPPGEAECSPVSPLFHSLPPSPSVSTPSLLPAAGTETPRVTGDCTPRRPRSPPTACESTEDPSALSPPPPSPPRSKSIPRLAGFESASSLGVPSLVESNSQTTVSTSESIATFGRMRNVPLASTVRNSLIEPHEMAHHAIPVIVETPREERDAFISASPVDADAEEPLPHLPKALQAAEEPPQRRTTEPAPRERRKSLIGGLSTMMSIRRFGRAKSSAGRPLGFDPAHLPPSPTRPVGFASQQQQQLRGRPAAAAGHQHRLSVSPTMHTDGSILAQASLIENEESRRMTEVAFM
ncbi:hypothetical protein C8R47DRAFT_1208844 [Mycena vitilis]|nr:hypothetical protein C8R47DRAFT_1208844 [Mycena vitilis]